MKKFWTALRFSWLTQAVDKLYEFVVELFFFVFLPFWIAAVLLLPFVEAPDQSRVTNPSNNERFRAVLMRGDNMRYYMSRTDLESVPYPDRPVLMQEIATPWCKEASQTFLPSVYVYDIQTGERLSSYNCVLRKLWTQLNKR